MRSMTSYASVIKNGKHGNVQVTLRSTNFKYLDIAVRNLLPEDILLEEEIKKEIKKEIYRGKIEVFIFFKNYQTQRVTIDKKVVQRYVSQGRKLAKELKINCNLDISDILSLPKVVVYEQKRKEVKPFVLTAAKDAIKKMVEFKVRGGVAIRAEIKKNLDKIKENVKKIIKLKPKVNKVDTGKEDIDEELSLMLFYVKKLESIISLKKTGVKGKSIDFLTQEILRELNAASSKTKKKRSAVLIVEAKNYLERIREQAQNVE